MAKNNKKSIKSPIKSNKSGGGYKTYRVAITRSFILFLSHIKSGKYTDSGRYGVDHGWR